MSKLHLSTEPSTKYLDKHDKDKNNNYNTFNTYLKNIFNFFYNNITINTLAIFLIILSIYILLTTEPLERNKEIIPRPNIILPYNAVSIY